MTPDIIEFVTDPQLLGLALSEAQEALLRAIYALPLRPRHLDCYRACTGRPDAPRAPFGEVAVVAGARSGKDSRIAGPIVCFEALFGGHEHHLAKGERGVIALVAQDARATRVAFAYVKDYLTGSRLLGGMVAEVLTSAITLTSGVPSSASPVPSAPSGGGPSPSACSTSWRSSGSKAKPIATSKSRPASAAACSASPPRGS